MKNEEYFAILFIAVVATIIMSISMTVCFMEHTPEYRIGSEVKKEMIQQMLKQIN